LETGDTPTLLGDARRPVADAQAGEDATDALRREHQQAFEAAHEQGFAAGAKDAEQQIAQQVARIEERLRVDHDAAQAQLGLERVRLQKYTTSLKSALQGFADDAELMAVEVAYAAVVRVLGEKSADRTLLPELCRSIVKEYGHPPATLRVSEVDFGLLDGTEIDIPVETDRRLAPGQCVIDTARGQFVSGLDVRLGALTQALLAAVTEHRGLV